MKILISLLLLAFSTPSLKTFGQNLNSKIIVGNLKNKSGNLYIGWYNNAATFPQKDRAVFFKIVKVSGQKELPVSFNDIPAGNYAIAVYLDENGNGLLDKNFIGVPKELYGFSNNITHAMHAPSFEESTVKFDQGRSDIQIDLR
jgi:uncharacterized protein (DUF2141 family)